MNSEPLEPVAEFTYLCYTVAYNNSNWEALYQNLRKARRKWVMVGKVVMNTGVTAQERVILYKSAVQ